MNWVRQAISDFGNRINIPTLALDEDNRLQLLLENDCKLVIQHLPDIALPEVVVSRSEPSRFTNPVILRQALRFADFRSPSPWPVQVGATNEELLVAMRIPERAFVINVLENTLTHLAGIHQKIFEK